MKINRMTQNHMMAQKKITRNKEANLPGEQVTIGQNDSGLDFMNKIGEMKSYDAGNAIADSLGYGLLGTIAGGVGAGFGASALGAGGIGIAGMAIIGGVVGGIASFHVASNVLWFNR